MRKSGNVQTNRESQELQIKKEMSLFQPVEAKANTQFFYAPKMYLIVKRGLDLTW